MHNHRASKGSIFVLFHMSQLFKHAYIHIQITGKSSSICMTARDDNDEGAFVKQPYVLHSIKFQNVWFVFV